MKILYITRKSERCGVADYGLRLFNILKPHFDITLCEANCEVDINYTGYDLALINYHYATLPFLTGKLPIKSVALFHEAFMHFEPDQVINVETLPRPLFQTMQGFINMVNLLNPKPVPSIGSFGFGFPNKDFPRIAQLVKEQFEKAIIKLVIPFAEYGDNEGSSARSEVEKCKEILKDTDIQLEICHSYFSHDDLLRFLSGNDINLFLYKHTGGRGLSSAIDYALSVKKPIGISNSEMFRHLPIEICVDNISIPELINKGIEPLREVYEDNTNEKLVSKIKELING